VRIERVVAAVVEEFGPIVASSIGWSARGKSSISIWESLAH
jgi:hypothetical protein